MRRTRRILGLLAILAAAAWAVACGAGGVLPVDGAADAAHGARLAAPSFIAIGGKLASSAPAGIWLTWTRDASGEAQGYYLYRDTASIPDPPSGNLNPALRVNGGAMIAQPPSGPAVSFNDMFAAVVGQTYYYRVTVVDSLGQESNPSNEISYTVHGQDISGFTPASAAWGDSVTINGDTFGSYNNLTDSVRFVRAGGGTVDGIIEAPADWTPTQIIVTVPVLAITGRVEVVIDGTIAQSADALVITNPYLTSLSPNPGFLQQELAVNGGNFGATRGTSTVHLGALDVSAAITSWSATQIKFTVPAGASAGGDVKVTKGGLDSNLLAWQPRPEIQSATTTSAEVGEHVVLLGRLFTDTEGEVLLDGTDPLTVVSWGDALIEVVIAGAVGAHTLTVRTTQPLDSNAFAFTIVDPLAVTMGGLTEGALYTTAVAHPVTITTPADSDSVELRISGTTLDTATSPFAAIDLPVAILTNGDYEVHLRANRRAVSVDSNSVNIHIYSLTGDVDGNGSVGLEDLAALDGYIGLTQADSAYRAWYDTDGDGTVTEADLTLVGYNFGQSILFPPPG